MRLIPLLTTRLLATLLLGGCATAKGAFQDIKPLAAAKLHAIIHEQLGILEDEQPTSCMSLDNIPQVAELVESTGRSYLLCWDGGE